MSSVDESIDHEVDIPFRMVQEKIIKVLTQSIYPSPNISVIRELVRNGIDSINAKNPAGDHGQITVSIDLENCIITVEDNGKGLSPNDLRQVYCNIGQTTKSPDSSLGIGSKSPLLMADTYLVQTWAEGSQPLSFTATRKGIKFLESPTIVPIPHYGTKVLIPFDPTKLDVNKLAADAKSVFEFVQIPVYLDANGQKELISTRSFKSIDLSTSNAVPYDYQPHNKATTSLFGATLRWDNSDWTAILLLKQDGNLRGSYESQLGGRWLRLYVDGLPLKCSRSLTDRTDLFPSSAKVAINIKNRDLVDVAADRENLLENEKTLTTLTSIQKATEEPAIASILTLPSSPYELLNWNKDHEDEELKIKLLNELSLIGVDQEQHGESLRRYVTAVTGWEATQLLLAAELLSLNVYVFEGKNSPIPWTNKTSNYPCNLIKTTRDAHRSGITVYAHRDARSKRILPIGSILVTPALRYRERKTKDEAVTHIIRLGVKSVDALPSARSSSNPIIQHGIRHNQAKTVIAKMHRKLPVNSLRNTVIVPSAGDLRAAIAAARVYLTELRFALTPRNQRDRHSLDRRRRYGVQKLEEYLRKDMQVTFMNAKHSLSQACLQWRAQCYEKTKKSVTRVMFPVPGEAKDILPPSLRVREFKQSRTILVDLIFVEDSNDLPLALIQIASILHHLIGFTFSKEFIEGLFRAVVTSKTVSQLMVRYHHAQPHRRKQWSPHSSWKHFFIYSTSYAIGTYTPYRRIRCAKSKDKYRYMFDKTKTKLHFSRKILNDMRLAFKILVLLLSSDRHVRELVFTTLSAIKIEDYTPYLRDMTKIATEIEQLAQNLASDHKGKQIRQ